MIYCDTNYRNCFMNRRVTAVFYGAQNCQEYWIIWNSWCTS